MAITTCIPSLSENILHDCDNPAVGGLEVNVAIGNRADIDYAACTFDSANKLKLTNLQLLPGKEMTFIQGVKQIQRGQSELVIKEAGTNKHRHLFAGVVLTRSVANKLQAQLMADGADLFIVVETKWKGASNADAFQVLGFRCGLYATVMTWNSAENDGAILFELASADGYEEPTLPLTLLETNYSTTRTAFNNGFAQAGS